MNEHALLHHGSPAGVRATNVWKRFGSKVALAGFDFEAAPGAITALLGRNGAGKTTAIRIFTTLLSADEGMVTIAGHVLSRTPHNVRQAISASAQQVAIDEELTAYENLLLVGRLRGRSGREARVRTLEYLEKFGLAHAAHRPARTYSGGEKRRLDLAMTLFEPSDVLFLDEPTTGLDAQVRRELWNTILAERNRGAAIVLTTQYLEEVDQLADLVTILVAGRVVSNGTTHELKQKIGERLLVIKLHSEGEAIAATAALVNSLDVEVVRDGREVVTSVDISGRMLVQATRCLDAAKIQVQSVLLREPSLEDVFLHLTQATT